MLKIAHNGHIQTWKFSIVFAGNDSAWYKTWKKQKQFFFEGGGGLLAILWLKNDW